MALFKVFIPGETPELIEYRGLKRLVRQTALDYPDCHSWTIHRDPYEEIKVYSCHRTNTGSVVYYGGGNAIRHEIPKPRPSKKKKKPQPEYAECSSAP